MKHLNLFRVLLLFTLAFVIFQSINKSAEEEIVYISEDIKSSEVASDLYEKGFIKNDFSYLIFRAIVAIKGGIESGGYTLQKGMGAVTAVFSLKDPDYKYIYIEEGLRKGQIANIVGDQLGWTQEQRNIFAYQGFACTEVGQEGFLATGEYIIHKDEDPIAVKQKMQDAFYKELKDLGLDSEVTDINSIIRIASLIQREAYDKHDMRLISGVIYNRLELGMPLQIDATLQYAKGDEEEWWPVPQSEDKYIDSPYNTYENDGLPPSPIATPGKSAILAALNPSSTDCVFYLHDKRGNIHCSTTYSGHKRNVAWYLK